MLLERTRKPCCSIICRSKYNLLVCNFIKWFVIILFVHKLVVQKLNNRRPTVSIFGIVDSLPSRVGRQREFDFLIWLTNETRFNYYNYTEYWNCIFVKEILQLNMMASWLLHFRYIYILKNGRWHFRLLGSCNIYQRVVWTKLCPFVIYCRVL